MKVNYRWRRYQIKHWIDNDPWDIVVHRDGKADVADSTFEVVGRISSAGARGAPLSLVPAGALRGEMEQHRMGNVLVLRWDETEVLAGDIVRAEHRASGNVTWFTVGLCRNLGGKREVTLHERN